MSGFVIKSCECQHEFQDKTYGKGKRVHTVSGKAGNLTPYTCTVCGKKKK